jgi:hypothetical protein
VTKRTDYTSEAVEAARSVMLELTRLLGEHQEGIVIVGGWVPKLLLSGAGHRHTGSLDVDLALDQHTWAKWATKPSCSSYFLMGITRENSLSSLELSLIQML